MYSRGAVWIADLPELGQKPVVIVSSEKVTFSLHPIVARITSVERPRAIGTAVPLRAGEIDELTDESFVICHDLFTLRNGALSRHVGKLSEGRVREVERGLQVALGMA